MKQSLSKIGVGVLAAIAVIVPITLVATASAQNPPAAGPRGQQGNFGPGQQPGQNPRFGGGGFAGGGGGGGSIAVDSSGLYVLQGNRVYRLDKGTLRVLAEGELPRPQMPQGFGGQGGGRPGFGGAAGGGQRGGGGGGNQTPPPDEN
jgi:translation initiation factor IF-2